MDCHARNHLKLFAITRVGKLLLKNWKSFFLRLSNLRSDRQIGQYLYTSNICILTYIHYICICT